MISRACGNPDIVGNHMSRLNFLTFDNFSLFIYTLHFDTERLSLNDFQRFFAGRINND